MSSKPLLILVTVAVMIGAVATADGQKRRNERPVAEKPPVAAGEKTETSTSDVKTERRPAKKNSRGTESTESVAIAVRNPDPFTHIYEFTQPDFMINRLVIRHDDKGHGDISFSKKGSDETITDPVQLSGTTLERLAAILAELDFLNSTENYQFEKDYSHLGSVKFTLISGDRSRTAAYNWTENKGAKALMDEYRRIGNQYVWMFDVNLARENQPLEAPKLLQVLDGYVRRGEISDPQQMLGFLEALGDDERIPLMARNHASKLITQLRKQEEKSKK